MTEKSFLLLISGPTASGKSALAQRIAERYGGEIISVDSAQVYRDMNIGTAKPDAATRAAVPHHLLDLVDPTETYSVAQFVRDARDAIGGIHNRHHLPILVGGTMLYIKALLEGLSDLPPANPKIRAEIDARASALGWPALHQALAKIDAQTAARLKPTDAQRIQRALEVWHITGIPLSALQGKRRHETEISSKYFHIALLPEDRKLLHTQIERRFDRMLENGLIDEVRHLRAHYLLTPEMSSMRSVGYRQIWRYLDGKDDFSTMRTKSIAATRQLAKRQITWLRGMSKDITLDPFAQSFSSSAMSAIASILKTPSDFANRQQRQDNASSFQSP